MSFSDSDLSRRRQRKFCGLIAGVLAAALSVSAAVRTGPLREHVAWLSDAGLAGRRAGEPGAARAAQYVSDQLKAAGYDVRMQEFSNNRRNVVARYGSADRHILIGAHYDGQAGFPSASDNAAGVALLLELAKDLRALDLPVSLVLVAFDDEEQGLHGANFYVENPVFPLEQLSAGIIFDTMGRSFLDLKQMTLFVLGAEYSPELAQAVQRRSRDNMLVAGVDLIGPRSDFAPFARKQIPFLFFSHATHKDYHSAGDRPELLNYDQLARDGEVIGQIVRDVASLRTRPTYLKQPVYPAREVDTLLKIIASVKAERPDLPTAYRLVFDDMESRIKTDRSRQTLNVAASALLALATPRFSPLALQLIVAPAYVGYGRPDIVKALSEEAAKWAR